jgi:hypothetical protein
MTLSLRTHVDSEFVLSTRYRKTRVFINKTISIETVYQQDLINRDLLSTRLIVGQQRKVNMYVHIIRKRENYIREAHCFLKFFLGI